MHLTHALIDRRIADLVALCMDKVEANPALLLLARNNVNKWVDGRVKTEWISILDLPLKSMRVALLADTEEAKRIRQSALFGGFLSMSERMEILRKYEL
jgi:hypothetical protein